MISLKRFCLTLPYTFKYVSITEWINYSQIKMDVFSDWNILYYFCGIIEMKCKRETFVARFNIVFMGQNTSK